MGDSRLTDHSFSAITAIVDTNNQLLCADSVDLLKNLAQYSTDTGLVRIPDTKDMQLPIIHITALWLASQ